MNFLKNLNNQLEGEEIFLFFDGLSIHKTKESINFLKNCLKWHPILNVAYNSSNNPIEYLFSQSK